MAAIRCTVCHQPYPDAGLPYVCPACGGVYDFDGPPVFDPTQVEPEQAGLWRYRHAFGLFPGAPVVSLGEGLTPLVWDVVNGRKVAFKMESLNPSGSYKDRGSAVLLSQLVARQAAQAVEDSSGNAGASFAAYAARAGVRSRVYVPDSASGPKRAQIERYGAELRPIPGPRSAAAAAVLADVAGGSVYASHAYLPFGLAGIATVAYELWEQLGAAPGTILSPCGHGGLMLGAMRGFAALQQAGLIERQPYYVAVQAAACAPGWAAYQHGLPAMQSVQEGSTLAEGVRVSRPLRVEAILREFPPQGGRFLAIPEEDILPGYHALAQRGLYVEPTSALVWSALQQVLGSVPDPVVVMLTGSGLKYQSW